MSLQAATNVFETLATSDTEIEVTVGGATVVAVPAVSAMATPTVAAIPLQHCGGLFTACTVNCTKVYKITQVQSGAQYLPLFSRTDHILFDFRVPTRRPWRGLFCDGMCKRKRLHR